MRKVNVIEFVSLDGVTEPPGRPEEDICEGPARTGAEGRESEMPAPVAHTTTRAITSHAISY